MSTGSTIGIIAIGAVALIALPIGCAAYSTWSSVSTAPSRVINKTLQTDNIITNYEAFHDVNANYGTRVRQLQQQAKDLAAETDPAEKQRLRMELRAIQTSCRALAAQYNANSDKMNRAPFKSRGLPETLDIASCES